MARAAGVSIGAPAATKSFCISTTIIAVLAALIASICIVQSSLAVPILLRDSAASQEFLRISVPLGCAATKFVRLLIALGAKSSDWPPRSVGSHHVPFREAYFYPHRLHIYSR